LLPLAYKLLDKAAKTGLIKKNTAARRKSSLAKRINFYSQN
jgi:ribosomal protein S20